MRSLALRGVWVSVLAVALFASTLAVSPFVADAQTDEVPVAPDVFTLPENRCVNVTATIRGTSGSDTLIGTSGDDVIFGLGGDDRIEGRGGNDIIVAGAGADEVFGGAGDDVVCGGSGDDRMFGGGGADYLRGQGGNDFVRGGTGDDVLLGNGGADNIAGQAGDDTISGGGQADQIAGGGGEDQIRGDNGADTISGGGQGDVIFGGNGNDTIQGNNGWDIIVGGAGADTIAGNNGNDTLFGSDGNDSLSGGSGDDVVVGGGQDGDTAVDADETLADSSGLGVVFNNDPVEVVLPEVDLVVPVPVENPPIPHVRSTQPDPPEVLPDVCSAGGGLSIAFPRPLPRPSPDNVRSQTTVPPGATIAGTVATSTAASGHVFNGSLGVGSAAVSYRSNGQPGIASWTNTSGAPVTITVSLSAAFATSAAGSAQASFTIQQGGGEPQPLCPDAELTQCLANGGNFFASDDVTIRGVIYLGCLLFDSPWVELGLSVEAVRELGARGLIDLTVERAAEEVFLELVTGLDALTQVTLGCVNAFGDLVGSIGDIITALLALFENPEEFLGEQYTLIRDTVNAAVQDPANFVDEALAGILRLDLLQENPAEWIGTIGCELLIEVLLTFTGAGAAVVAVRLAEKVIDFIQARQRVNNDSSVPDRPTRPLTTDEQDAILRYTGVDEFGVDGSDEINKYLRGDDFEGDADLLAAEADTLRNALEALPEFEGTVFRGTDLPDEVADRIFEGGTFRDRGFQSTSIDPGGAFEGDFQFTIESRTGTSIGDFSSFPGEAEVLFVPDTEFLITSVEIVDGQVFVEMTELI